MRKIAALFSIACAIALQGHTQPALTGNVMIVTLDGFRWQELFGGADEVLINDPAFSFDTASLKKKYWAATPVERRKKLLPFFWGTIAQQGQLHGNRQYGSKVDVKNRYWFSYPGYNEILTGYPDTLVNSNDKNPNKNINILEFINREPAYKGRVAAFTSWDCFDAILNEERAGFIVSSGFDPVKLSSPQFELLNELQMNSPQPLGNGVRPDHITYNMAKQYIREYKPRVLYIAFDETDDYAHGGRYDYYLDLAHMTDRWIGDLWTTLQSMPEYKGRTTLLITTDHGRGDKVKKEWTSHGARIADAHEIWLAALGAGIPAKGEVKSEEQLYQAQVAQTVAYLLGLDFKPAQPVEPAMKSITK